MKLKKNKSIIIEDIFKNSTYLDAHCATQDSALLISNIDLKDGLADKQFEIISIINNVNQSLPFEVHQKIPYKTFNVDEFIPDFNKDYVIVCNKGITSYDVTKKIKEKFPQLAVFSLVNGIDNY